MDEDADDSFLLYDDLDGDGAGCGTDCDDTNASLTPLDTDGDILSSCVGDCNDGAWSVHPLVTEWVSDGVDQDCDGVELCYEDGDGDELLDDSTVSFSSTRVRSR